ncbi:T9SS type B sorting domain-containing protein [Crocinitomix catalasitica]|uniref:T9SS type B sorting domain-containing protein n=1 Tax=Crocinitomix catalasitica TaxID=184607 RepID=UPI000685471F|nr:gliding motility-associated C-terminal domain-containing protein [Crocinitomix catalasitica]
MKLSRFFLFINVIFILGFSNQLIAQDFVNPHLDGIISGTGSLPDGWERIPASDPISKATSEGVTDTPDLANIEGPRLSIGVAAKPQIGENCLIGSYAVFVETYTTWHEGIQQTVSGLNPGTEYEISFYQAVIKQKDVESDTGFWFVYLDNDLIHITEETVSKVWWQDVNVEWQNRSMKFEATDYSHTFKFIPGTWEKPKKIRMGIDNIHLRCPIPELREDTTICYGHKVRLDVKVTNGTYLWNDGNNDPIRAIGEPGNYIVKVDNGCRIMTDSVLISTIDCPVIIEMPNVFTPNGDGVNDLFKPIKINEIQEWHLIIKNRWGVVLFESIDPYEPWDGKIEGTLCVDGVYYWSIYATDSFQKLQRLNGPLTLIR